VSNLSTCVRELRRWHEQKHHFPNYLKWSTAWQTDEDNLYTWRQAVKQSSFLSSRGSWRLWQTVGDRTLLQIWKRQWTWYVSARSITRIQQIPRVRTVNKRILITANKRIHKISAYFLAAANDKRMCLLTSLYGIYSESVLGVYAGRRGCFHINIMYYALYR